MAEKPTVLRLTVSVNRYSHQQLAKKSADDSSFMLVSFIVRAHRPDFLCTYVASEVVLLVRLRYDAQLSG